MQKSYPHSYTYGLGVVRSHAEVCSHEEIGQQQAALAGLHELQQLDPLVLLPARNTSQVRTPPAPTEGLPFHC